jgi:hypothetical protein
VSFYAWGAAGGEIIKFEAGNGLTKTDGFQVSTTVTLTTAPSPYEFSLVGVQYTCQSVRLGFGWYTNRAVAVTFYIDNIQWQ